MFRRQRCGAERDGLRFAKASRVKREVSRGVVGPSRESLVHLRPTLSPHRVFVFALRYIMPETFGAGVTNLRCIGISNHIGRAGKIKYPHPFQ